MESAVRARRTFSLGLLVTLSLLIADPAQAIEAVRGKSYKLTKQHGPWMIMVASFHDVPPDRHKPGMTAEQAAQELVFELREKGIPAYTFQQESVVEKINTHDRLGREDERRYTAQQGMVSVLAGNYPSIEDSVAQKTLQYVKKFHPKFLKEEGNGGIFRVTPGRPGPLAGAFLSINPLLSPDEVMRRQRDEVIVRLNSGVDNSLFQNRGKFTVVVATFTGRSMVPNSMSNFAVAASEFDKKIDGTLNEAGEDAEQLARALRQRNFEAYVYHDRYQSIVTVGSFDSPNDPLVRKTAEFFGAKMKPDPKTGQEVLVSEVLTMPGAKPKDPPQRTWLFDPYPRLFEVPKMTR